MRSMLTFALAGVTIASGQSTSIDTMLATTCDGTISIFPGNEFLNVNVDIPFLPRVYSSGIESIGEYLKQYCGSDYNSNVLKSRFDLGATILNGNRWFKGLPLDADSCVDKVETFTRTMMGFYEQTYDRAYEMPPTCDYETWTEKGNCAFEVGFGGMTDITLQVRAERCANYNGFPRVSVGCKGTGCNVFTPCTKDADCSANQLCRDVDDAFEPGDLLEALGFTAPGSYDKSKTQLLVSKFVAAFGTYFNGAVTGSSLCMPLRVGLKGGLSQLFESAWGAGTWGRFSECSSPGMSRWRKFLYFGIVREWDGLVDGKSPFDTAPTVTFPAAKYPSGEYHALSVQCDGLIHLFAGTGHSIRVYKPHLSKILDLWGQSNMEAYPFSTTDDYIKNMAVWRPEPYLMLANPGSSKGNLNTLINNGFLQPFSFSDSFLSYDTWKSKGTLTASIGVKGGVWGSDFKANIRVDQCTEPMGLVGTHVSCVGEICKSLLLQNSCTQSSQCPTGSTCDPLSGYYDNDYAAQYLWGNAGSGGGGWANNMVCPQRDTIGDNYNKLTTLEPATNALSQGLNALRFANCEGRDASKCVSACKSENGKCVPSNGTPTALETGSGLCLIESVGEEDLISINRQVSPYVVSFPDISEITSTASYASEETVVSPFTEPSNTVPSSSAIPAYETVAMFSCSGNLRLFPDNDMFSMTIDAPIASALARKYIPTIERYVTNRCSSKTKPTTKTLLERFHPISWLLSSGPPGYDSCLDDTDTLVRDLFSDGDTLEKYFLPETCNSKTWLDDGVCKGKIRFPVIPDMTFNIDVRKCEGDSGMVTAAVGCEGSACNMFLTPCVTDSECGLRSKCIGPDSQAATDLYEFFKDKMFMYDPNSASSNTKASDLFKSIVEKFKSYFKGSNAEATKICFPDFPSMKVEESGPVFDQEEEKQAICGLTLPVSSDYWKYFTYSYGNTLPLYVAPDYRMTLTGKIATLPQEIIDWEAEAASKFRTPWGFYRYVRGMDVTYQGETYKTGGGSCQTHADCNTLDGPTNFCVSSREFCNMTTSCYADLNLLPNDDRACVCSFENDYSSMVSIAASGGYDRAVYAHGFSLGEKCEKKTKYFSSSQSKAKLFPNLPMFYSWDGLLASGGSHFQKAAGWEPFPAVTIPVGETSLMSVQCSGVISFMEGTALAVRIYAPQLQDVLQFIGDKYVTEMANWIPAGEPPADAYRRVQAPWRPEMYIWNLIADSPTAVSTFKGFASYFNFGDDRMSFGDFKYDAFLSGLTSGIGMSYSGMKYMLGNDFKANVRFQSCPSHPYGLTQVDIGCQGDVCDTFKLQKPCTSDSDCQVGSCISTGLYDSDFVAEILWGAEDEGFPIKSGQNWADATTCPKQWGRGKMGVSPSLDMLYQSGASWYEVVFQSSCAGKPECACVGSCSWSSGTCMETSAPLDAKWQSQEIKLCLPKMFPFPSAFLEDKGFPTGEVGQANSANIYTVTKGTGITYGVDKDITLLQGAPQRTSIVVVDSTCGGEPDGPKSAADNSDSGLSTGALVGIIAGAVVVLAAIAGYFLCQKSKSQPAHFDELNINPEPLKDVELGGRL